MTMAISTTVPDELIAGDTWKWTREYADFPPATWVVTFYFENGTAAWNIVATTSGSLFLATMTAAASAAIVPGVYAWFARATQGAESYVVPGESGWLTVLADPASAGMVDRRSYNRQLLDAINATLLGSATTDQMAMTIGGRSLQRRSLSELEDLKVKTERRVNQEMGLSNRIFVRLSRG